MFVTGLKISNIQIPFFLNLMLCSALQFKFVQIPRTCMANNLLALTSDKNLLKFHRNVILKILLLYRKKNFFFFLNEEFLSLVVLEKLSSTKSKNGFVSEPKSSVHSKGNGHVRS